MVHTLLRIVEIGIGGYLGIAILMVPCRLLGVMVWPMHVMSHDRDSETLLPMSIRRMCREPIPSRLYWGIFFASPFLFFGGIFVWMAYGMIKQWARITHRLYAQSPSAQSEESVA